MYLEREIAVIGCTNEILLQGLEPYINAEIVHQYIRMLEVRSGYAVIPGFSWDVLEGLLSRSESLFQYDLRKSGEMRQETYRILFEGERNEQAIGRFIQEMIDILDPAVNYPLSLLKDMRLLPALQGDFY